MTPAAQSVLDSVRQLLGAAGEELPAVLGELERLRAEAIVRAARPQAAPENLVLTPGEAAARLGRSVSWVYKNKATLPIVRFPSGGWGVSAAKLARTIERRST